MCRHTKYNSQTRHTSKADAQLSEIPSRDPTHAEHFVLLVAGICYARGERTTIVIGVFQAAAIGETRDDDERTFTALG